MALHEDVVQALESFIVDALTAVAASFGRPTRFELIWDDLSCGPLYVGVGFTADYGSLEEPPESKRKLALFCGDRLAMKRDGNKALRYSTYPWLQLSSPFAYRLEVPHFDAFEKAAAALRKKFAKDAEFFPKSTWDFDSDPYEALRWCELAIRNAVWTVVKRLKKDQRMKGIELVLHPHDNELVSVSYFAKNLSDSISARRQELGRAPSAATIDAFVDLLSSDKSVREALHAKIRPAK